MGHMAIKTLVGFKSEFARFWSQVLAKAQNSRRTQTTKKNTKTIQNFLKKKKEVILQKLQGNTSMRKCLLQHLRRTLNAQKIDSINVKTFMQCLSEINYD